MSEPDHIKSKLVLVLTNMVFRSIEEARKVPYVVEQDSIVDLLVTNPGLYQQMILEGQIDADGTPRGKVIVKLDILSQIDDFNGLNQFAMSFSRISQDDDKDNGPARVFTQIDLLTKMFTAYTSNMITLFEREFEQFSERLRKSFQNSTTSVPAIQLFDEDLESVERIAQNHLDEGRFVEGFSFGRLLSPEVVSREWIRFPSVDYSLSRRLIERAPKDSAFFSRLIRFILRASYVSQHSWHDLYEVLLDLARQDAKTYHRSTLIDLIEGDFVFACNLLQADFDDLRKKEPEERRALLVEASFAGG